MPIRTFFLLGGAMLGALGGLAAVLLVFATTRLTETVTEIETAVQSVYSAQEMRRLVLNADRDILVGSDPLPHQELARLQQEKMRLMAEIEKHVGTKAETEIARNLRVYVEEYMGYLKHISETDDRHSIARPAEAVLRRIRSAANELIELNRSQAEELELRAVAASRWTDLLGRLMLLGIGALIVAGLIAGRNFIYHPLAELKRAMDGFRRGEKPTFPSRGLIKELNVLAESFREMTEVISEQRQAQLRFMASVAHDIRNPLNAMQAALRLLKDKFGDKPEVASLLTTTSNQVAQLASLTNDLSDTAVIASGHVTLNRKECDLVQLIENARSLFGQGLESHRVVSETPPSCMLYCDPFRLTQVINNLLSNAIKYSPQGGTVIIGVRCEDRWAELSVADQGIGISVEDQEQIFKPFRRSKGAERAFEGMGLGLSIVRKIVEAHGGRVEVESDLGTGSTFRVRLPMDR